MPNNELNLRRCSQALKEIPGSGITVRELMSSGLAISRVVNQVTQSSEKDENLSKLLIRF
jgi:hypothetical protein